MKKYLAIANAIKEIQKKSLIYLSKDDVEVIRDPKTSIFYLLKPLGRGGFGVVYLAYQIELEKDKVKSVSDQYATVVKKLHPQPAEVTQKEVAGLTKLYDEVSYILPGDSHSNSFIFSPFFPGKPLIPEQELTSKILELNGEIEKILHRDSENTSFPAFAFIIAEMARQLYRVNTPSLNETLPDKGAARIHGDIKGSNFHLYIDEKGQIQLFLFDFGTSEKIIIEQGSPLPTELDQCPFSPGHITKTMLSSEDLKLSSSQKYIRTVSDDIHNLSPIISCLLGAENPYYDKAKAVYDTIIEETVSNYDLYIVDNIHEFKLPEDKKPAIVFAKENGRYHAFYYKDQELRTTGIIEETSDVSVGDDKTPPVTKSKNNYLSYPLDDIVEEEKLASGDLSLKDKNALIRKALQLNGDILLGKLKLRMRHYRAEPGVPYSLHGLYEHDLFTKWEDTKKYAETFLRRMQGFTENQEFGRFSLQADSLETRLFWGFFHHFAEKNKDAKLISLGPSQATFDMLITDTLQRNKSFEIKQFRKTVESFFARVDANNLHDKIPEEMNLFWETVNRFFSTYQMSLEDTNVLPVLNNLLDKLKILSCPGLAKKVWGAEFKDQDDSQLNKDTVESQMFKAAINEANTMHLRKVSLKEFQAKYNEIKQSKEYAPSFLNYLTSHVRLTGEDKKQLEILQQKISTALDDFDRFSIINAFIKENPLSPITQKMKPMLDPKENQKKGELLEIKEGRSFEL